MSNTIDVVANPSPEQMAVATVSQAPLDRPSADFSAALERRGANRKTLMKWIADSLVEGHDFGKIHVVKRDKCDKGNRCTNPAHFSKPVLFKPGSEKICGMLGVTPSFPTLKDYEQAALKGVKIETIILRCEMNNENGFVIGTGVGARIVEKDYGDINKSLKMAAKSAVIDATLRMGGLSEIFTQDLEDMQAVDAVNSAPPKTQATAPQPQTQQPSQKPATEKTREWLVKALEPMWADAIRYFSALKILPPNQGLTELPLKYVPVSRKALEDLMGKIKEYASKASQSAQDGEPRSDDPEGENEPPEVNGDDWRGFLMPFGEQKGTPFDELDRKYLFGLWANYKVVTEYKGRPLTQAQIRSNQEMRTMLDAAGEEMDFRL